MILLLAAALVGVLEAENIRIGFGSCAHQDSTQVVWNAVAEWEPDLFVHLGDAVYADTRDSLSMRAIYEKGFANPAFRSVRERVPFLATWDDHDYGENDAGASYVMRRASQALFFEFWNEPDSSERIRRDGVYGSKVIAKGGYSVQIIVLDTRFFRSAWTKDPAVGRRYRHDPDPAKTVLGEGQWSWLEGELAHAADFRIIASSIQVINDEHGWECWGNFPRERDRLLDLVHSHANVPTVFVSGDRHFTELSRTMVGQQPIYDMTSSGLTQVAMTGHKVPNSRRIGKAVSVQNFAGVTLDLESGTVTFQSFGRRGAVLFLHEVSISGMTGGSR